MTCEGCQENQDLDGILPECLQEGGSCPLPLLGPAAGRALEIRDKILRLEGRVEAGAILRIYEATIEDLEFLAVVEDELGRIYRGKQKETRGENEGS